MGATNLPNGLSVAGVAIQCGVTSVTGSGTISTELDTITGINCSLGTALGTATSQVWTCSGTAHANASGAASFIARAYTGVGGTATAAAPIVWTAIGTKA